MSQNRPFSYMFFFFWAKKSQKETFFDILDRRKSSLDLKSEVLTKSKKIAILQRGYSMVFVKKSTFFWYVFFSQKSQKERFFDILDRKGYFLDLKSEVLKSRKNRHFANGLVHGISQKIDLFLICSFEQRKPEWNIFWSSG